MVAFEVALPASMPPKSKEQAEVLAGRWVAKLWL